MTNSEEITNHIQGAPLVDDARGGGNGTVSFEYVTLVTFVPVTERARRARWLILVIKLQFSSQRSADPQ